ncbi:hypothetical protein REPUB_Repub13aG0127400 [Reevesia pubescens]
MELPALLARIIATVSLLGFIGLLDALILKPERLRSKLRNQGIRGPPPSLLLGNFRDAMKMIRYKGSKLPRGDQAITHNCSSLLFPFFDHCRKQYGPTFMLSIANVLTLHTNHPDVVREIGKCTSFDLGKSSFQLKAFQPLLGQSIVNSNGEVWAHQRKLFVPEFYMDKVKGMMRKIGDSTVTLVNTWNNKIDCEGGVADIKVDDYMRNFSTDVIARACFGSNYAEAEKILLKAKALEDILSKGLLLHGILGLSYLPTKSNMEAWKLKKEINTLILKVIKERKNGISEREDLLQTIIEGSKSSNLGQDPESFIIDSCKVIFLSGYDATALSATWTLMLLALYPQWQEKLTMVVNESLRLYPPIPIIPREALDDMKFGDIDVPKGVNILVSIIALHQDPDIWGPDADKFKPERFSNGISGACKYPRVFMPWGFGPHTCLGQHLASAIIKILLVTIVSNFKFSISPNYRHSPCVSLAIEPEFGVDLLVQKL